MFKYVGKTTSGGRRYVKSAGTIAQLAEVVVRNPGNWFALHDALVEEGYETLAKLGNQYPQNMAKAIVRTRNNIKRLESVLKARVTNLPALLVAFRQHSDEQDEMHREHWADDGYDERADALWRRFANRVNRLGFNRAVLDALADTSDPHLREIALFSGLI